MLVDVPTIYLFAGVLYLLLPLTAWMVLSGQRSPLAMYWCIGGELVGIGMILFAFRHVLPGWATYSLGNYALWAGNMVLILTIGRMLNYKLKASLFAWAWLFFALVFEYFRIVLESPQLRFMWTALIMTVSMSALAWMTARLARVEGVQSARWLSRAYYFSAALLLLRVVRVLMGEGPPEAVAGTLNSALIVSAALVTSVFGNFAFIAVFLERASHQLMSVTAERVRKEEADRLNQQISQLERQRTLGAMSASFAHELSQPMTAILMDAQNAQMALHESPPNAQVIERSVQEIEHSASRVVALVNRIRNFIRPSPVSREVVDLQELAREVPQLLAHDVRRDDVSFQFEFESGSWDILADRVQLSQILLNVYRNAIQAMSQAQVKKIRVIGELTDAGVVVRIQDTGPGLAEELKGKVGTPFMTSKAEGLGVGFSISKAIAESHGGHLSISNAQGGGAVVELSLPFSPPEA
jgi:C4-dicarboxylate-specific signal transduction histidine kinase